jgi:hypothetical protein
MQKGDPFLTGQTGGWCRLSGYRQVAKTSLACSRRTAQLTVRKRPRADGVARGVISSRNSVGFSPVVAGARSPGSLTPTDVVISRLIRFCRVSYQCSTGEMSSGPKFKPCGSTGVLHWRLFITVGDGISPCQPYRDRAVAGWQKPRVIRGGSARVLVAQSYHLVTQSAAPRLRSARAHD